MSKLSKLVLVIGLCLLCLGLAISKFDIDTLLQPFYDESKYEKLEIIVEPTENLNKIVIKTNNDNIIIKPTSGEQVKITYYESDDDYYNYDIIDGVLTLKNKEKIKFFDINFNLYYKNEIIIEVPIEMLLNYDIKTSNGKLKTNNIVANNLNFKTSNGKIEINNTTINGSLSIKTSNGRINLDKVSAKKINGSSSNGGIKLINVTTNRLELSTSNGRIEFENLDSPYIQLKTSNGKILGSVEGKATEYKRYMKTSDSKIIVDGTEYSNKIDDSKANKYYIYLKTSNGRIEVDFNK